MLILSLLTRTWPRSAIGEAWIEKALHGIQTDEAEWKAKFMRVWRLRAERSAREQDRLMAYLVADTRIPDHTLWHHNGLVSALQTAGDKPSFLLFQIGPVQEFIARSRSMLDLWSGSYLLSLLISKALATVALEVGPDAHPFSLCAKRIRKRRWQNSYAKIQSALKGGYAFVERAIIQPPVPGGIDQS